MRHFVHRENIKHLSGVIEHSMDAAERCRLQKLLIEEEAKFEEAERQVLATTFSDPSTVQVLCRPCNWRMSIWSTQDMEIRGKGRFPAVNLVCEKCHAMQLVLGDKPISNKAAE